MRWRKEVIMEDTISAVATAWGEGGIGIVRISGPEAKDVLERIFLPIKKNRKKGEGLQPDSVGETIGSPMGDGTGSASTLDATGLRQLPSDATPIITSWPAPAKAVAIFCARDQGPSMRESANIGITRILMLLPLYCFPAPYRLSGRGKNVMGIIAYA